MERFKVEVHKPIQHDSKLSHKQGDAQQGSSENPSSQRVYVSLQINLVESSLLALVLSTLRQLQY